MIKRAIFFGFIFITGFTLVSKAQSYPFDTLMRRIQVDLQEDFSDQTLEKRIKENLQLLNPDGSWKDVDYADARFDALIRIKEMAIAFTRKGHKLNNNKELYFRIDKSLNNWYDQNPINKNWWYNEIFYPQAVGQILIIMRSAETKLKADLEHKLIDRMSRKLRKNDGANTSDEALHYLYRACLTENTGTLDSAAKSLYEPIVIANDKEGPQPDESYYQHGKQQAIGSYGQVFADNSVKAVYYLQGTRYELQKDSADILINYLKNTLLKTIRGSFYDFNVRGRGISRKDSLIGNVSKMTNKMISYNPENATYWKASSERTSGKKPASFGINPSHNHYWKTGYTLHVTPEYTISVQTASKRTIRTERGNNENILGKFLSDGATNIQVNGAEYVNLMPIWEWDKIPGTTSRDYKIDTGATIKKDWLVPGTTDFVGGVSDGNYGVSAYDLDYDSVQAKKAWFFFDKEVVCLGAGIKSITNEPITTTINQSWLTGDVSYLFNQKFKVLAQNNTISLSSGWVLHGNVGYYFPQKNNISLTNGQQSGNWYRINSLSGSKTPEKGNVFKLFINHGLKPVNKTYAYIIKPGIKTKTDVENSNISGIKILENTEALQAVYHTDLDMLQMVFYQPTALKKESFYVVVDHPCTLLIKIIKTAPMLFIADPAQKQSNINVKIKLASMVSELNCEMPVGAFAGSTKGFKIN